MLQGALPGLAAGLNYNPELGKTGDAVGQHRQPCSRTCFSGKRLGTGMETGKPRTESLDTGCAHDATPTPQVTATVLKDTCLKTWRLREPPTCTFWLKL